MRKQLKESVKQAFKIAPDQSTLLFFSGIYDWEERDNEKPDRGK